MIWFVGSTITINPSSPVVLGCGNGCAVSPNALAGDLEANIIIIWGQERLKKIVVISVDTLYLGPQVSDTIINRLSPLFADHEIFLSATHTHNAPMIDETKPLLGSKEHQYSESLVNKIVGKTFELAKSDPKLVSVAQRKVRVSGIVSRRKPRFLAFSRKGIRVNQILQRPNFAANTKPYATIADFLDSDSQVLGSLLVFPCHPVAQMGLEIISPDFVGPLRNEYRLTTSGRADIPFLFLQGSSGDLNPWIKARYLKGGTLRFLDQIVNGVLFSSFTESELTDWTRQRVSELLGPALPQDSRRGQKNQGLLSTNIVKIPLGVFLESAEDLETRKIQIHRISVESLNIIGISAELTWALRDDLEKILDGSEVVGCIRDSFGYLSSASQEGQGGYESFGHQDSFSITSDRDKRFLKHLGDLVMQTNSGSELR